MSLRSGTGVVITAALTALLCQGATGQDAQTKDAPTKEAQAQAKGLPPRATPGDYQAHAQVGGITLAAEFAGHSITSAQGVLSTEDFVVVEVGFFGPPDAHLQLSGDNFSLRINGKKPLADQPYLMIFGSLKDPEWEPPEPPAPKASATSIGGSGKGQSDPGSPPPVVHVPIAIERGWQQRVLKAALPEGDRALPAAGLIFFKYHGKTDNMDSIELSYAGPAGKTTLNLHR